MIETLAAAAADALAAAREIIDDHYDDDIDLDLVRRYERGAAILAALVDAMTAPKP